MLRRATLLGAALVAVLAAPATASARAPRTSKLVLLSHPGDYVGGGQSYRYTARDSSIQAGVYTDGAVRAQVLQPATGPLRDFWYLLFVPPEGQPLQQGRTYTSGDGAQVWVEGNGSGCDYTSGSFTVREVEVRPDGTLASARIQFTQFCNDATAPLDGTLSFTRPWSPPSPPPTASYFWAHSEFGDYIGAGGDYLYTLDDGSTFTATAYPAGVVVNVESADHHDDWNLGFSDPSGAPLHAGFYTGGLNVTGLGRGCDPPSGSFAVKRLVIRRGVVRALDVSFTQHCDGGGGTPPLIGEVIFTR